MRTIFVFLIVIVLLTSCGDKRNQNAKSLTLKPDSVMQVDNATDFLNLFNDIDPEGLHIYPISWDKNGQIIKTPFEGVAIDVQKYSYTDDKKLFINIEACKKGLGNIYAIGKFDINDNYYGLVMRQYSQYEESLIQLMLWDKKHNIIINGLDLADSFGDAGWYFDFESWIKDYQFNGILEIVSRRKDYIPKENFTSKVEMDSITTDTLKISRLSNSKFITRIGNQQDTIKFKLKNWK